MEPLILSIDCGTQSLRAILFNKDGETEAIEKVTFEPYFSLHPGWTEQKPEVYYGALCTAARRLRDSHAEKFSRIIALALASQRDTTVFLDKDLKPVRPAILWLDQREADVSPEQYYSPAEIAKYSLVGMLKTSRHVMRHSRTYWVQKNESEIWAKTDKVVLLSCYLNYLLTGNLADSYAAQIGHIPFNVKTSDWHHGKNNISYRQFGVREDQMPRLVPPGSLLGNVTRKTAEDSGIPEGLPVIAAASDKGCETLGNGCLAEDTASLSFGTTATVQTTTSKYVEVLRFIPPYPSAVPGRYNPEYEVFRGYWLIGWFKKEFAAHEVEEAERLGISAEDLLNKALAGIPPGAGGLMLQPYWTPELKMEDARGVILGFNDSHTRIHIYRAIIEGINFAIMDGIERMENRTKTKITRAMVSGGGSKSSEICQITADMLGMPVSRVQTNETSGLGAAMIGFTGMKEFADMDAAVAGMAHIRETFTPNPLSGKVYKRLYRDVYKSLFPALCKIYKTSNSILEVQ